MKQKRLRAPKSKPGELKVQWGKLPHDNPDLIYAWGDGCYKADGHLINSMFSGKQIRLAFGEEIKEHGGKSYFFDKSILEELQERGYDITTLKFYIRKKL